MMDIENRPSPHLFSPEQMREVSEAVTLAEELVSDFHKLSTYQWRLLRYDIRTSADLTPGEIVHGPLAEVVRYTAKPPNSVLTSDEYVFYLICLQDHAILSALDRNRCLRLFPFMLYIATHELIHIVRFSHFLQLFDVPREERIAEEKRVHERTRQILKSVNIPGMPEVTDFFEKGEMLIESVR